MALDFATVARSVFVRQEGLGESKPTGLGSVKMGLKRNGTV